MITIFVTIKLKFMILAAILILCKLEGQDVKIIFGICHFWIQHAQINLKSHRYHFSHVCTSYVHITEMDLVYSKWSLNWRRVRGSRARKSDGSILKP